MTQNIVSIRTNEDYILHFIPVNTAETFRLDFTLTYYEKVEGHGHSYEQPQAVHLNEVLKPKVKIIGVLDELTDEIALYYVKVLPGGVFKNYAPEEFEAETFNSPKASLKSAWIAASKNLIYSKKLLVLAENV